MSAYAEAGYAEFANAKVVAVPGDVGDPATAGRVADEAVRRFGRLDSLVNDAGIYIIATGVGPAGRRDPAAQRSGP